MKFIPAHKHVLVQKRNKVEEQEQSLVLLPQGYQPKKEDYTRVTVLQTSNNCTIPW